MHTKEILQLFPQKKISLYLHKNSYRIGFDVDACCGSYTWACPGKFLK